jgi:hypothetical protein
VVKLCLYYYKGSRSSSIVNQLQPSYLLVCRLKFYRYQPGLAVDQRSSSRIAITASTLAPNSSLRLIDTITGTAAFAAADIARVCRMQQAAAVATLCWPGVAKDACLDKRIVDKARPADGRFPNTLS